MAEMRREMMAPEGKGKRFHHHGLRFFLELRRVAT